MVMNRREEEEIKLVPETKKPQIKKKNFKQKFRKNFLNNWQLYVFILPALLYFIIFHYGPMYGIQIAFKNYIPSLGIWDSPWVGFDHFRRFFNSYYFTDLLRNTLGISIYELVVGFPMPIVLALMLNEAKNGPFKRITQTVTYAPHFISVVVIVGMLVSFLSPSTGLVNHILDAVGLERHAFLEDPRWFKTIYVLSGVWQSTGWNSVIYMAALSSVDPQLHEAATIDGATKLQRLWYINIPALIPTIVILLILNMGTIMSMGYEKILLMQNPLNMASSNVIATFTYQQGLLDAQYSYAAAVGMFNAVINAVLLLSVNKITSKISNVSLW